MTSREQLSLAKVCLSSDFVCIKNSRPLVFFGFEGQTLGTLFENKVHSKSQSYENMSIIKVGFPFLHSSMKKNQKVSVDFWHRKMILKVRIALLMTFKTKKNKRSRIFLYTPIWSWGQPYSSLNSAKLSWMSEVTLIPIFLTHKCVHLSFFLCQYLLLLRINSRWVRNSISEKWPHNCTKKSIQYNMIF